MYKLHNRNFLVVKDGDTLDIGGKTLKFKETPYLHTAETMITFCEEDRILFPCDTLSGNKQIIVQNQLALKEYKD